MLFLTDVEVEVALGVPFPAGFCASAQVRSRSGGPARKAAAAVEMGAAAKAGYNPSIHGISAFLSKRDAERAAGKPPTAAQAPLSKCAAAAAAAPTSLWSSAQRSSGGACAGQDDSDLDSMCSMSGGAAAASGCSISIDGSPAAEKEKAGVKVERNAGSSSSATGLHPFFSGSGGKRRNSAHAGGAAGGGGGGIKVPKKHAGGRGNKKAGGASAGDKAWEAEMLARVDDFPAKRTVYSDAQKQQG